MVGGEDQFGALGAAPDQCQAQQRRDGQVEAGCLVLCQEACERLVLVGVGQVTEIDLPPGQFDVPDDDLHEVAGGVGGEGHREVGVPVQKGLPHRPHPAGVDRPVQVVDGLQVVGVGAGVGQHGLEEHAGLHRGQRPYVPQPRVAPAEGFGVLYAEGEQWRIAALVGGRGLPGGLGEPGDGAQLEDLAGGDRPAPEPGPGDGLDGADGIAAQGDEVVVDADPVHAQDIGVDGGQDLLPRRSRCAVGGAGQAGLRQGLAVDLSVGSEGKPVQGHDRPGDHVLREAVRGEPVECVEVGAAAVLHDDVGDELIAVRQYGALLHRGVRAQHRLDLAELHPQPVELDLEVLAAQEFDQAVLTEPRHVAGAVEALAHSGVRPLQEALGGALGLAEVPAGHPRTGQVQLSGYARGHGLETVVEDVGALVRHRTAVRDARPVRVGLHHLVDRGVDGCLGGAAEGEHAHRGGDLADPAGKRDGDPVPAQHGGAQVAQRLGPALLQVVGQQVEEGRGGVPDRHAVLDQEFGPVRRVLRASGGGDDHGAAGGGDAEVLVDGHVEAGGRQGQDRVVRPGQEAGVEVGDVVDHAPVVERDRLGRTGGAGGVDDVAEVIGGGHGLGVVRGAGRQVGAPGAEHDQGGVGPGQARGECVAGHDDGARGACDHAGDPLGRVVRVERHVRTARLEDAEHRYEQFRRAFQAEADPCVRPDPQGTQVVGEAVGRGVDLTEGEPCAFVDGRGRVRPLPGTGFEGVVEAAAVRQVRPGPVPVDQHAPQFGVGEQAEVGDRCVGPAQRVLEEGSVVREDPACGTGVEEGAVVVEFHQPVADDEPELVGGRAVDQLHRTDEGQCEGDGFRGGCGPGGHGAGQLAQGPRAGDLDPRVGGARAVGAVVSDAFLAGVAVEQRGERGRVRGLPVEAGHRGVRVEAAGLHRRAPRLRAGAAGPVRGQQNGRLRQVRVLVGVVHCPAPIRAAGARSPASRTSG